MVMFTDKPNFTFRWVCLSTFSVFFLLIGIHFIRDWKVALLKKTKQRYGKFFFPAVKFVTTSFFLLENPTHWDLKTAVCPIFAKPVLDIFAVCSLVPRMNLYHTQQSYLCPKNQNYLLYKTDLGFFFSYGLRK